jgi:alkanesulfonate monooxygenase SsuD/methylene tetrahydromethanopterin reductase-like flavin-dependent oxidoreductase (luciferase family)
MKLVDFADEVRNQKGNYGSFDELLKTTDTSQTVEEFGRRFLVDRVLVATGTPKSIADKLEEMHVATGSNGGFILARGYSAMDNIREFVEHVVPELRRRGLARKEYAGPTLRENLD